MIASQHEHAITESAHEGSRTEEATAGRRDPLALEAIYSSAPGPRGFASLTVLGLVFDKIYFPGVYLPKDGFNQAELNAEIERLLALPSPMDPGRAVLIGMLRLVEHAKTLDGFCDFTAPRENAFGSPSDIPAGMVENLYYSIFPRRAGWIRWTRSIRCPTAW